MRKARLSALVGCWPWALAATVGLLLPGMAGVASAQYSPNCERNGKRDYCAITPIAGATNEKQSFEMLTYADHTVYELLRNETSCKQVSQTVRTCDAKIISPPGNPRSTAAFYRGTYYEGGYKHEFVGQGIHLIYYFLD